MGWNRKRDAIEPDCVELLERAGWKVLRVSAKHGPDAIAARHLRTVSFEFKGKRNRKDQPQQQAWRDSWPGEIATIYSVDEMTAWLSGR